MAIPQKGISTKWRQKAERGIGVLPCSRPAERIGDKREKGCSLKDVVSFERVAGGAPANVGAAIAKLGGKSGFISQLGQDAFGDYIIEVLQQAGVDTQYILRTTKAGTGLAFVSLKSDGNRDFSFYRNPSADLLMQPEQVEEDWFKIN